MKKIAVLILAGGSSNRMNNNKIVKQYLPLGSQAVIYHSLYPFVNHQKINKVICVIKKSDEKIFHAATKEFKNIDVVIGGNERCDSVYNGLQALKKYQPDIVFIHDAARPFISKQLIDDILQKFANGSRCIISAAKIYDTVKKINIENQKYNKNNLSNIEIDSTLNRNEILLAETPQAFYFNDILSAYQSAMNAQKSNFTDDAQLMENMGYKINVVFSAKKNFKITTQEDYRLALNIMNQRIENQKEKEIRTGFGADFHKFNKTSNDNKNKIIKLGGVKIDSKYEIIAHSDGDVLIHALIDALLGAVGKGDIGELFPDSDNKYKNYNSAFFLKEVKDILQELEVTIVNIDVTVICQIPKISPHKNDIKNSLAKILQINKDRINVKATTTENMGFLGRSEGIAVFANCLVNI